VTELNFQIRYYLSCFNKI